MLRVFVLSVLFCAASGWAYGGEETGRDFIDEFRPYVESVKEDFPQYMNDLKTIWAEMEAENVPWKERMKYIWEYIQTEFEALREEHGGSSG